MCGIGSIISLSDGMQNISLEDINLISNGLKSRGPDSKGNYLSKKKDIALICRRLATQDSRKLANQPCYSSDGNMVGVLNGEIYNHNELRKELLLLGFNFKSNNDTEVLVNAYRAWGNKIFQKISGQYAFIIHDRASNEIIAARDPMGICPLYYFAHDNKIIFSSNIKTLIDLNYKKFQLNKSALIDFFISDFVYDGKTFFEDISYLKAGYYFKISNNKKYHIKKFTKIKKSSVIYKNFLSEKDCTFQLLNILEDSVHKTLQGDKKIGLYLSGGIDSVSIMALIKKNFPNFDLKTFSVGFEDISSGNAKGELDFARRMSDYYNCDFHQVVVNQEDLINNFAKFEQPQASFIETSLDKLSKKCADLKIQVALSGEGIDEMFLGYDHYLAVIGNLDSKYKFLKEKYTIRNKYFKSIKNKKISLLDIFLGGGSDIDLFNKLGEFINVNFNKKNFFKQHISQSLKEISNEKIKSDIGQQLMYIDYNNKVAECLLRRAEFPSMNNGVEMRFPYLMDELINFCYKIPLDYKIGSGTTKYLFRQTLKDLVPADVLNRAKSPFALPGVRSRHFQKSNLNFFKPAFKELIFNNKKHINEIFNDGLFNKENLININFFKKRLSFQNSKKNSYFDPVIWKLWSFSEWYEKYFYAK
jgi:asparagine synthase (glutamine-hydrolysing)